MLHVVIEEKDSTDPLVGSEIFIGQSKSHAQIGRGVEANICKY